MIKAVFKTFLKTLFPEDITCDVCKAELIAKSRYNLCSSCLNKLETVPENFCEMCGTPILNEAHYCIRCMRDKVFVFAMARSPLAFKGLSAKLIKDFKFAKKKYLATLLTALMADKYIEQSMNADIVVCVPMTAKEEKTKKYNHSKVLAVKVAERLNLPYEDILVKVKETESQKKLSAAERQENLQGSFALSDCVIKNKIIMIVDDVFTTGATANECARVLLKGGAKEVVVLTACVTPEKPPVA